MDDCLRIQPGNGQAADTPAPTHPPTRRKCRRLSPLVADAKRLARLLGVGVRSIRTWDYAGKLPRPIKLGTRTVWVLGGESGIRAWLTAGAPPRQEWEARKRNDL
jgi:hypothetical protein